MYLKILPLVLIFLSGSVLADIHCTYCKKKISGQYLMSKSKKPYCSKKCFSSLLPKCSVCKKAISGRYRSAQNKVFCSEKCFSVILPKCNLCKSPVTKAFKVEESKYCVNCIKHPRCFTCRHPSLKVLKYKDGRNYCKACSTDLIFDETKAAAIYKEASNFHKKLLGKAGLKIPPMKFVDMNTLKNQHGHGGEGGMSLRGYYHEVSKETTVTDQNNKVISRKEEKTAEFIYLLNGMKREDILVTAVHELTHDWIADYFPGMKVAPLWIEEGFCQYVSWNFCNQQKYTKLSEKIKNAPDAVYGKGAKFFIQKFGKDNIDGALRWMVSQKYHIKPPPGSKRKD